MVKIACNLAMVLFGTGLLPANQVLPDRFPELSTEAWVEEAEVAPDGSVFLLGDFTAVDGIPRPGLARLQPDGRLDPDFAPLEVENLNIIDEFGSVLITGLGRNPDELFALENGGLIRSNDFRFEVRGADGRIDSHSLSDLRNGVSSVHPEFERNGKLWMVVRDESALAQIVVRNSSDLAPLDGFSFSLDFPSPPMALSPGPADKIWVLGQSLSNSTSDGSHAFMQCLYRLNPDGTLDDTFSPESLSSSRTYKMEKNRGAGLTLSRITRQFFNVSDNRLGHRLFEFRDAQGAIEATASLPYVLLGRSQYTVTGGQVMGYQISEPSIIRSNADGRETVVTLDPSNFPVATTSIEIFPDDCILVGGTRRYLDTGEPDRSWHTPRFEGPTKVHQLIPFMDGNILAIGNFDLVSGVRRLGGICLMPDGSFDPVFSPAIDLRHCKQISQKKDGNFLVLLNHGTVKPAPYSLEILELDPRGRLLKSIPINFAGNGFSPDTGWYFTGSVSAFFELQPDDSIVLKVTTGSEVPYTTSWLIPANDPENPVNLHLDGSDIRVRMLADGRLLMGSKIRTPEGQPIPGMRQLPSGTSMLASFDDGNLLLVEVGVGWRRLFLWHPDQGRIPGFEFNDSTKLGIFNPVVRQTARDKFLVGDFQIAPVPDLSFLNWENPFRAKSLRRLHPNGTLDPTFQVTPGPRTSIFSFHPRNTESSKPTVWIAGNFTEINGVPRDGLAIIADNQASGFQEWMRACAGIAPDIPTTFDENGDQDGDGFSNLFEYAAGSHPIQRLGLPQGLTQTGPRTWQIPCNPEAPEIIRRLEVSANLIDWRPPRAGDLRLETGLRCLSWTLQNMQREIYVRLKITR